VHDVVGCVGSVNDFHLFDSFDVDYHHVKVGEDRTTRSGCLCKNVVFVCFLKSVTLRSADALFIRR